MSVRIPSVAEASAADPAARDAIEAVRDLLASGDWYSRSEVVAYMRHEFLGNRRDRAWWLVGALISEGELELGGDPGERLIRKTPVA